MPTFLDLYTDRIDTELGSNDSVVLFTTARRKAAINEGIREFADLTDCWQRTAEITCSNGVAGYSLTSTVTVPSGDYLRMTAEGPTYQYKDASSNVTYISGDNFPRRSEAWLNAHDPGWRDSTGAVSPSAYYLDESDGDLSLTMVPPPEISTASSGVLSIPYVARPSSLTNDTEVPFTDTAGTRRTDLFPYHQATVHFAAHKLEKLRKDPEAADYQLKKFLGYVTRFLQTKRPKGGSTLRPSRSYFGNARRGGLDADGPRAKWW